MDPISDMLIRIKNASSAGKKGTTVPFSNFKLSVAKFLADKGYLSTAEKQGKTPASAVIEVELAKVDGKTPKIKGLRRVSKPSKRVYYGTKNIKPIKNGTGMVVLSTPKGILDGESARKMQVGGEVLFVIW